MANLDSNTSFNLTDIEVDANTQSNVVNVSAEAMLAVTTDKADYPPESVATITATNVGTGGLVQFVVTDTHPEDGIVSGTSVPWTVADGGVGDLDGATNGAVVTTWNVNQDAANQSFALTATDLSNGNTASMSFTDQPVPITPKITINPNITSGLDLTIAQSSGSVNGAIFQEVTNTGNGSGASDAFLRINGNPHDTDLTTSTEEGFNTNGVVKKKHFAA